MTARIGALVFALLLVASGSRLCAQPAVGTGTVVLVDFVQRSIALEDAAGCGLPWNNKFTFHPIPIFNLKFTRETEFEYGAGNPVDSSKLLVARTVEFACPEAPAGTRPALRNAFPTKKVIVTDTSERHPPGLPSGLGRFPLSDLVASVNARDRYSFVQGAMETRNGVVVRRLKPDFDIGDCRIVPDPEHIQCDFAYSEALSNLLVELVESAVPGFVPEARLSGRSARTYVNRARRVRVRFLDAPPFSTITVEVY